MPLLLHRSHDLHRLAQLLAGIVEHAHPDDPFTPHTVVVGSRGMERWLRAQLAQAHGICANVRFEFPARAFDRILQLGEPPGPDPDPWSPAALVWTILEVLPTLPPDVLEGSGLTPTSAPVSRAQWGIAREIADVLDRYHLARPDRIAAFLGQEPPEHPVERWQGALWRACRDRLAIPSPPERFQAARAALSRGHRVDLPALYLFGITTVPPIWLDLLDAVSAVIPVHLFQFSPSEQWWADFLTPAEARRQARRSPVSRADVQHDLDRQHPLLTSLGRLSRDMQALLTEHAPDAVEPTAPSLGSTEPPTTCLHRLQQDLLDLRDLSDGSEPHPLSDRDRSLQIHACAGPARQAHALRDALLDLFATDPTLEPRDVVVLTPDIDTYGPLVQAALEQGGERPDDPAWIDVGGPRIPCAVSDHRLRAANHAAEALLAVLGFIDGRVTASAALDLLRLPPVARRFDLSASECDVVRSWFEDAGWRWAFDDVDRAHEGQPLDLHHTMVFAVRRLALDVLTGPSPAVWRDTSGHGTTPIGGLEGHRARTLGKLAAFLDTLHARVGALKRSRPATAMIDEVRQAWTALTRPEADDRPAFEEVHQALDGFARAATAFNGLVAPSAVHYALTRHFEQTRHNDRPITGAVSVSALAPMRSVPFRVVAIVGLDEGVFPRRANQPAWDLVALRPRVGDRNPRDEDRHLLLESIFAAKDALILTCTGTDPQRGAPTPLSAPVDELIDTLDRSFVVNDGALRPRDVLVRRHPLQPTSANTFHGAAPSFDARSARIAAALHGPRDPWRGLPATGPLTQGLGDLVSIDDLADSISRPQRTLVRRLRLPSAFDTEAMADREPLEVTGLQRWKAIDELMEEVERRTDPPIDELTAVLRARGYLQPGNPGVIQADTLGSEVLSLASEVSKHRAPSRSISVDVTLPSGRRVVGSLSGLGPRGPVLASPSAPTRAATLMRAWIQLLALACAEDAERAVVVGFGDKRRVQTVEIRAPLDPASTLDQLIDLAERTVREPILLFPTVSPEIARLLASREEDEPPEPASLFATASVAWRKEPVSADQRPTGDGVDADVVRLHGTSPPFIRDDGTLDPDLVELARVAWVPLFRHIEPSAGSRGGR